MKDSSLIYGGLILLFIGLVPLKRHFSEYEVQKNGEIITAIIVNVPNCFGTKIRHFLKFRYNNKIYSKTIGKPCEEYKVGETLYLKHIEGIDIFLYEDEKVEWEIASFLILAVSGLGCIIFNLKRK